MDRTDAPTEPVRILVGVDGSAGSETALRWACNEAALRPATVTALTAWSADGRPRRVYHLAVHADPSGFTDAARTLLDTTIVRVHDDYPDAAVTPVVRRAEPVAALLEMAAQADMVVVGARGDSAMRRLLVGSTSQGVVHHCTVPVIVAREVRRPGVPETRPVVVGVDGSTTSFAALRWAAGEAATRGVPLRVVHSWGGLDPLYSDMLLSSEQAVLRVARELLDDALKLCLDGAPEAEIHPVVASDRPAVALLRESSHAQLLVVGSRGGGGFADLDLGSVSHQCVLHAACSVAVVRSDQTTI
jgi:nucleotide-binding universal stress UspA family protein